MVPINDLNEIVLPKEKTYYSLVLIVSIIVWVFLLFSIMGLFVALGMGVMIWFSQGVFVNMLKAEGVKISSEQNEKLMKTFEEVCEKLDLAQIPELYVIESGGLLNAFTTRFCGRDFVVIYADALEAYGEDSDEIRFLLGHEIGHIQRKHIIKDLFIWPGYMVPLLGLAYKRACESSCDRYGAFSCEDPEGAVRGMMILAGGKVTGKDFDPKVFAKQHYEDKGFFRSIYEYSSPYPPLSKRVAHLIAFKENKEPEDPPRSFLGLIFSIFTGFGGNANSGGIASLMIFVAVMGMLVAIGVPGFIQARNRSHGRMELQNLETINTAIMAYSVNERDPLNNLGQLWPSDPNISDPASYIVKQLKCPVKGASYMFDPENQEAYCEEHGNMEGVRNSFGRRRHHSSVNQSSHHCSS